MSLGEADAKFPGQASPAFPPSPSRENPGQVYPKSDPKAAPQKSVPGTGGEHDPSVMHALGNPYALDDALGKLDLSLTNVISAIQCEESSVGASPEVQTLVQKFINWRQEIDSLRAGHKRVVNGSKTGTTLQGGMFSD